MPRTTRGKRPDPYIQNKAREVRRLAQASGLIKRGAKNRTLSVRIGDELVEAAKRRTGIRSDSELVETAVASFVVEDDFWERLLSLKGSLPRDFEIDL